MGESAEFCGPQNASGVNFEFLAGRASGDRLRLRWRLGLATGTLGVRLRELLGA